MANIMHLTIGTTQIPNEFHFFGPPCKVSGHFTTLTFRPFALFRHQKLQTTATMTSSFPRRLSRQFVFTVVCNLSVAETPRNVRNSPASTCYGCVGDVYLHVLWAYTRLKPWPSSALDRQSETRIWRCRIVAVVVSLSPSSTLRVFPSDV